MLLTIKYTQWINFEVLICCTFEEDSLGNWTLAAEQCAKLAH